MRVSFKENNPFFGQFCLWYLLFSFGLTDYLDGYSTSEFVYEYKDKVPFWWKKLNKNAFFKSALKKRWN